MSVARAIRLLLAFVAAGIVVWSFYDVARRAVLRHRAEALRPVTLTVLHWGNPAEDRIVADLVRTYEQQNPHVRIVRINTGGGSGDMTNKLKTMMAAGAPPDVFYLPPNLLPELAQLKLIADLGPYVSKEPKGWDADFFPILLDAFRYDAATGMIGSGPLYAIPKDFTTSVFYINVDLFEEAGVDWRGIQKDGWTWERFQQEMRKITDLRQRPELAGREIYGTLFQIWPDTLRNVLWTFGGDFFHTDASGKPDFRDVALDTPGSVAGLELIARMRLVDRTAFNATGIAKDGGQEFINGNIGCTGPIGRWMVPTYKTIRGFRWDVLPVPYAAQRASQMFYTGWTMASKSEHPDEAYKLIRFLTGPEGQVQQARAGLAIPCRKSVAYSDDFLNPPPPADPNDVPIPPHNSRAFLDAIELARLQQIPRQAEWTRILEIGINRAIQTGQATPLLAAGDIERAWLDELDSPLRRRGPRPMPWRQILLATAAVVVTAGAALWWKARREHLGPLDRAQERAGWAFIAPWVIGFLALTLGPMVLSLLLSFSRWTGLTPLAEAEFVGAANFGQLFRHDPTFTQSLKVTAYYVLLAVPVFQVAALAVALLMNSRVRGITIFRTIYFVPSVVSGVALAVLWLQLFNNDYGLINEVLRPILSPLGLRPPNWFGVDTLANPPVNDAARWAIPAFVVMGLWGVGGGMIIYLAGLKGIPASLYEAATIDGAGPLRRFYNITLPMLSPLIFYNLVMGIIGSFQVFTQAYVMTGPGPDNATLFYVLNLYRQAFEFHSMGYASAMAWVLFLICLVLTILVFRGSRNLVYYEGLKA